MQKSDLVHSDLTGRDYYPSHTVRIVNYLQSLYYWLSGCLPVDIYPSQDFKTGKPLLVYLFLRDETTELYDKWCNHEVDWEGLYEKNNIS